MTKRMLVGSWESFPHMDQQHAAEPDKWMTKRMPVGTWESFPHMDQQHAAAFPPVSQQVNNETVVPFTQLTSSGHSIGLLWQVLQLLSFCTNYATI